MISICLSGYTFMSRSCTVTANQIRRSYKNDQSNISVTVYCVTRKYNRLSWLIANKKLPKVSAHLSAQPYTWRIEKVVQSNKIFDNGVLYVLKLQVAKGI